MSDETVSVYKIEYFFFTIFALILIIVIRHQYDFLQRLNDIYIFNVSILIPDKCACFEAI